MDIAIVIPSRYGSKRLPGKPMLPIRGKSLLHRVWSIGKAVTGVSEVYVATDDERIAEHARGFGAVPVMTSPDCENGTERAHAAIRTLAKRPDAVINLQGDAVLTPPWVVQALVDAFHADPSVSIVTAAVHCTWEQVAALEEHKRANPASGTLVTMDKSGRCTSRKTSSRSCAPATSRQSRRCSGTSASTAIRWRRSTASPRWSRRRWSGPSSWSSCARWRTASPSRW